MGWRWATFRGRRMSQNILKRFVFGRFLGMEKEKTNIRDTWKIMKHVKKYRIRDHPKSYKGHKALIDKYKCGFVEIKNKKQLNNLIKDIG